jgi:hypothetical protein
MVEMFLVRLLSLLPKPGPVNLLLNRQLQLLLQAYRAGAAVREITVALR